MWTEFVFEKQVKSDKTQKEQYIPNCPLFSKNNNTQSTENNKSA